MQKILGHSIILSCDVIKPMHYYIAILLAQFEELHLKLGMNQKKKLDYLSLYHVFCFVSVVKIQDRDSI